MQSNIVHMADIYHYNHAHKMGMNVPANILHAIQTDNNVQHSPSTSQTFLQQFLSVLIVQQKQHIVSSTKTPITSTSAIMDISGTVSAK